MNSVKPYDKMIMPYQGLKGELALKVKSIHRQILRNQLLLSIVTILIIYISAYIILYFTVMHNANKQLENNITFLDNYMDGFFTSYDEKWALINANQDIRNYIVHSNETDDPQDPTLFYSSIDYLFNFTDDTNLTINNLTQQLLPPNDLAGWIDAPHALSSSGIYVSKDRYFIHYELGIQNFTETQWIGSLNFKIPVENLQIYLNEKVPPDMVIEIYDSEENRIYTSDNRDILGPKYNLQEDRKSQLTGLTIHGILNIQREVDNLHRFVIFLFPMIVIVIIINIILSYNLSTRIVHPIKALIGSIKKAEQGDMTYKHSRYDLEEIDDLSQSYHKLIHKINYLLEKNHKMNVLKVESQLNALQQKIDPHFLFNTLELISSQAILEEAKATSKMTQKLGNLFRYNLRAPDTITVGQELKYIEDYLFLQKIRFDHALSVTFDLCEDAKKYKIPQLTLQPLVENCIKHGFNDLGSKKYQIFIKTHIEDGFLSIIIKDNGKGIPQDLLRDINHSIQMDVNNFQYFISRKEHIGLRNVNARLCLQYHIKQALTLTSNQHEGTVVTIKVPVQHKKEDGPC